MHAYWKTNDVMRMTFGSCLNLLLEKVKGLISGQPQKENPLVKSTAKKGKGSSECPHHFGYLASRPKNASMPQECLTCKKMLDCRNMSSLA